MTYLLIAEKPSLCRDIESCYKNHRGEIQRAVGDIEFVALAGHVCTNYEPNDYPQWGQGGWDSIIYPMVPEQWKIKVIDDARKKALVKDLKSRIRDYDGIIVATDSDQEGFGIYYLLEQYLGIGDMKALRFMEHSLTGGEILKSLLTMTDFHTEPTNVNFVNAFRLRSYADWLYGMNLTRLMTVKTGTLLNVGRVKAPTIKLVYDNSMAIDQFKPKQYYELEANYGTFKATYSKDGKAVQFERESDIPSAPTDGTVSEKKTERSTTHAPKLFDLTAIQAEAGVQFGFKPNETLELIQSLYEKHKVISYPRTQCRCVSSEKAKEFPRMLKQAAVFPELAPLLSGISNDDIQRVYKDKSVVNDKEVQKESHDALLPTDKAPVLSELSERELKICLLIYKRLVMQFLPAAQDDKTTLVIKHGEYDFIARGLVVVQQGWRVLHKEKSGAELPPLNEGDKVTAQKMEHAQKTTKAPKRLTQATLINAMKNIATQISDPELKKSLAESQGIGTPATRAAIIEDILKRGFIEDKKGGVYITKAGVAYIQSLEGIDIVSPVFAAQMDTEIKKIQRGEQTFETAYNQVVDDLSTVCKQVESKDYSGIAAAAVYECPSCHKQLISQKYSLSCPDCGLKISKVICGTTLSEGDINTLLSGKPTAKKKFKKKDGGTFTARLVLKDNDVKFDFDSGVKCPKCGADNIRINKAGAFCDACDFKLFRKIANHSLTDRELNTLLTKGTVYVNGFTSSKTGKEFSAGLKLKDGKTEFVFGGKEGSKSKAKGKRSS